jgi:hypothetical protein
MLPATVLVSQPSIGLLLQSRNPVLQVPITQRPAAQLAAALANWQMLPQLPQLAVVMEVFTSQPLSSLLSQLAKPVLQAASEHVPVRHAATPLVRRQTMPQELQLLASFWRSRHTVDPPTVHAVVPIAQVEVHIPAEHTVPAPQTLPQVPQLEFSVWSARHVPLQKDCPVGQVQTPAWQDCPPEHVTPHAVAPVVGPQLLLSVCGLTQVVPHNT